LPRRSNYNTTRAAYRRGIIRTLALWVLCRPRHKSHWTGHSSRLGRDLKNRFGSDAYAAEELIAELSSAILGAELGLPVTHLDHHASYIASWLKILKSDERAILTAAAKAEEAASLLLKLGGCQSHESKPDINLADAA